jgi:hypothetical protein
MKIIKFYMAIDLIMIVSVLNGQPKDDLIQCIQQRTKEIMSTLKIAVRPNIHKDGKLVVSYWKDLDGAPAAAVFRIHSDVAGIINPEDPDSTYYIDPFILTNAALKEILVNPPSRTHESIHAISVVVHELTHYYQRDEDIFRKKYIKYDANKNNFKEYVSQQCELDAYAAQAFFYLQELLPEKLKLILELDELDLAKKKMINEFQQLSGRQKPFDF